MQTLLLQNWGRCDPAYWSYQPDHRYRFPSAELEAMAEHLMIPEEREAFYRVYDHLGLKMKVANLLRIPYALACWLIRDRERQVREEEEWERRSEAKEELVDLMADLLDEDLFVNESRKCFEAKAIPEKFLCLGYPLLRRG